MVAFCQSVLLKTDDADDDDDDDEECVRNGYNVIQESAAYATVSVSERQSRHLANTFEVAAIECLTWLAT